MRVGLYAGLGLVTMAVLWSSSAIAQSVSSDADALVRQGDRLAKSQRYDEALVAFKSADMLFPRAKHDCLIGMVYLRLNRVTQGHFYLSRCQQRSRSDRPTPWFPKAMGLAQKKVRQGEFALVTISSVPTGAKLYLSMFESNEVIRVPASLWLPIGRHTVDARAVGYAPKQLAIEVVDKREQAVQIKFDKKASAAPAGQVKFSPTKAVPPPKKSAPAKETAKASPGAPKASSPGAPKTPGASTASAPPPPPPTAPGAPPPPPVPGMLPAVDAEAALKVESGSGLKVWGWSSLAVGVAALGASGYLFTLADESARAADATNEKSIREQELKNYNLYSLLTYGAYALGGIASATGATLLVLDSVGMSSAPSASVSAVPTAGGATLLVHGQF